MTKQSFKHAVFAASLMAATTLTPSALKATVYNDVTGETISVPIIDIVKVEVSNNIADLIFKIDLNGDVVATDWGKYCIAIDTTGGGDTLGNGWNRPISMSAGMDYWVGSWVDSGNGVQLWQYTTSWATTGGPNISKSGSNVTITVPFSQMGLNIGSNFTFDVVSTGGGGGDSAIDSLANPAQSVATWAGPYDISSYSPLPSYTLVQPPDPTNKVTFLVDMQVPIALWDEGGFPVPLDALDTNNQAVFVRGNFNGWNASSEYALIQVGPTLFSNTVDVVWPNNGTILYKFYIDTPVEETTVMSCNASRTLQITSLTMTAPLAYWGDRKTSDPTVNVTYSVDMSLREASGLFTNGVSAVSLRGSFNGWGTTAMTNRPAPDTNIFDVVLSYPYTPIGSCYNSGFYKFYYNPPETWENDPNRSLTTTITNVNTVLPTVYWNHNPYRLGWRDETGVGKSEMGKQG
ncbi:MAG: hypothetical protein MUE94_12810 [Verrucomicrobia bacterium]|jgi:hypothetical protein|nr:hypothetical protein [Verrucomicrobiota bacterium]